jgi:two-component system nitrogen regulation sensor histidine kinase NtrY
VFGTLYILEDISDLSRAQRIAAWQEVARRMAHEIKNPLTPVRLSAQRIRKKFKERAPDLEEAILQGTTTIEREVEGMLTIVNEFSRFARLPEVHPRPGSLTGLVRETVDSYRTAYPKVAFELDFPESFPPVRLDSEQLGRVFKNLVENSIEAMKMSGSIRVAIWEHEGSAVLAFRDTGPGLTPEARSRLFLPYYSTKRKGSGLGLAIVARIVEEHGGHIAVDPSYQEGAGFLLTLPLG